MTMMGYGGFGAMGAFGGLGMVLGLLLWIGVIALVVWGASSLLGGQRPPEREETPLEILRRRYAAGELSRDEFEQAKRALG